jgi:hypothetical protein
MQQADMPIFDRIEVSAHMGEALWGKHHLVGDPYRLSPLLYWQ